jgi:hypothetical protein
MRWLIPLLMVLCLAQPQPALARPSWLRRAETTVLHGHQQRQRDDSYVARARDPKVLAAAAVLFAVALATLVYARKRIARRLERERADRYLRQRLSRAERELLSLGDSSEEQA